MDSAPGSQQAALDRLASQLDLLLGETGLDEAALDDRLSRLVAGFPADLIRQQLRGRLGSLAGVRGDAILRLVEALGDEALAADVADALERQPELASERVWEILNLLQNFEVLQTRPQLLERLDEWNEALEEAGSLLDDLAELIEEPEEGPALVLEGLGRMDPESRLMVVELLGELAPGPGLRQTLDFLAHCLDPATRDAAQRLIQSEPVGSEPVVVDSLISVPDAQGRATVAIHSRLGTRHATASFLCDVLRGIVDVAGLIEGDASPGCQWLDEVASRPGVETLRGTNGLAQALLSGCLSIGASEAPIELGYWLDVTLGQTRPSGSLLTPLPAEPASNDLAAVLAQSKQVLDACGFWADDSDLTYDLAEELLLRQDDLPPSPERDAGMYRYLFEHRMCERLELDQRLLLWMAAFWDAGGQDELSCAALAVAGHLADSENVMPGHPFLVSLMTRSLQLAQRRLREGTDLRDPTTRLAHGQPAWP